MCCASAMQPTKRVEDHAEQDGCQACAVKRHLEQDATACRQGSGSERELGRAVESSQPTGRGGGSSRAAWNWKWMVGCPGTPAASSGGADAGALQVARMSRYFFPLVDVPLPRQPGTGRTARCGRARRHLSDGLPAMECPA